jgi:hypothetical protein
MRFPRQDKLVKSIRFVKAKGIKEADENYWPEIVSYYEGVLGGKVVGDLDFKEVEKPEPKVVKEMASEKEEKPKQPRRR